MQILEIEGYYFNKFDLPNKAIKIYKRVFKNVKFLEPQEFRESFKQQMIKNQNLK